MMVMIGEAMKRKRSSFLFGNFLVSKTENGGCGRKGAAADFWRNGSMAGAACNTLSPTLLLNTDTQTHPHTDISKESQ
jgi:hypothetical protein